MTTNKLLNDQLSNIGLVMPSSGITHQFLTKNKDVLSDDLIDLISYSDDLQGEERRIQKRILELEQAKPSLRAEDTPPYTRDDIMGMSVEQLGQVITANNITDDMFKPLIYNSQKKRVFRANNLGKQIDKPELRIYVLSHYGL